MLRQVHRELLTRMDLEIKEEHRTESNEYLLVLERYIEEIALQQGVNGAEQRELQAHLAGCAALADLIDRLVGGAPANLLGDLRRSARWSRIVTLHPEREHDLQGLVAGLRSSLGIGDTADLSAQMQLVENGFWNEWHGVDRQLLPDLRLYLALRQLKKQIKDIVFGYGPLEDLLRAPNITEIMVVDSDRIYIERNGVVENSGRQFVSDDVTLTVIERIVSQVGRRIDKSQPLVDARLTDGSRVNAVIPPLAVSGPCLTIRKFPTRRLTVPDLIAAGSVTAVVADFLKAAVHASKNILIAGGTGTGKTTLLNCLAEFIPAKERIVTIEDTAELQLHKDHVVRLETKPVSPDGTGEYSIHDLVRNALRMRPDRIVVGECRGPEALDMLQAMNTGHDGSMTTIHANSPRDVILRLEVLVQSAASLPIASIHRQIASAVDLVVQLTRLRDGRRCVTRVTEFVDVDPERPGLRTRDLFVWEPSPAGGQLFPTGRLPTFMDELLRTGGIGLDALFR
jgi:Flp pilus assembly CpaF family ATPase